MRTRDEHKINAIQEEAVKLIVKEGFDGLSMHKLAKAASVSPATIYIYYKDRDDLIRQIALEEINKLLKASLANFNPDLSFAEGLKVQWHNRANYFMMNPLKMKFMEQIRYTRYHDESISIKSDFMQIMTTFVMRAITNQELIKLPLEVYWSIAFAPLYKLVEYHINKKGMKGKEFTLTEEDLDLALQLVLKALKP